MGLVDCFTVHDKFTLEAGVSHQIVGHSISWEQMHIRMWSASYDASLNNAVHDSKSDS